MILEDTDLVTTKWLPRDLVRDEDLQQRSDEKTVAEVREQTVTVSPQFVMPENGVNLENVELSLVEQAMERSGGNQTRAAELLGISRDQLRYRLKKLEESPGR
jgi:DNA-binding protein Fis